MAIGPRLDLRQSQSLVMTPQLQQAIKLLALSNLELEAFVGEELEKNPLLEMAAEDGGEAPAPTDPATDSPDRKDDRHDNLIEGSDSLGDAPLDVDYGTETFIDDGPGDAVQAERTGPSMGEAMQSHDSSGEPIDFDSFAASDIGLHEHLMGQAGATFSGRDLLVAGQLIAQIDEAGYLEADIRDVAYQLGVGTGEIEAVLARIHMFDPTGVGARSLSECLAIQAREADRYDPAMAKLIDNLELLAKGAIPQLRRLCDVDEEDMADMIRELREYDPKPGLRYASDIAHAVVPDIFVREKGAGWIVELNSATLPRLLVNRRYYRELSAKSSTTAPQDKQSKLWLADRLASANWLLKALDQRQRTILRVAEEIVRHQEGFFRHGVVHLKPLTLRQVGEAIEMHESTISRVTSNKYLSCSRGVFELKYFFKSGIQATDGGEAVSAEAVKSHIRDLIAAEAPDAILSDDALVEILKARGFDIARRTVAKYREAIGLGSSVQRRRQKAIAGTR
ncbi:MAG TPA: RNA polymerase factor sigma-54 [Sphingobium sp.]|uniref:RNA polymerase factor sigma-54 n=1 Tax=Sphingobium sp. TaxID=1912891 RepID=UPI002ED1D151